MRKYARSILLMMVATFIANQSFSADTVTVNNQGEQVRAITGDVSTNYPPGSAIIPMVATGNEEDPDTISTVASNPDNGAFVSEEGVISFPSGESSSGDGETSSAADPGLNFQAATVRVKIDKMDFGSTYSESYSSHPGPYFRGSGTHRSRPGLPVRRIMPDTRPHH